MNRVKIGIMIENRQFYEDIVRRIAEMATGVEFLIPDCGEAVDEDADFVVTEAMAEAYFPVSILTEKIASEAGEGFRACLRGKQSGPVRTYVVRSRYGGSGCTAAGLTIARILAGRSGGRAAFICSSQRDAENYGEGPESRRTGRELEYMLSHGLDADITEYGVWEKYGTAVFTAGSQAGNLADWLKTQGFAAIVTDAGCTLHGRRLTGQAVINIESWGDSRTGDFEQYAAEEISSGSREYYVLNKAPYRMGEGRFMKVAADDASFFRRGKKIEIAMDGAFAASMRELVTMIEKELDDGQSDFFK